MSVGAGANHSVCVVASGRVFGWGHAEYNQQGVAGVMLLLLLLLLLLLSLLLLLFVVAVVAIAVVAIFSSHHGKATDMDTS